MTEQGTKLWASFYEVIDTFRRLEPWQLLMGGDLCAIQLPEREEPWWCTVLGRMGGDRGLTLRYGRKGLAEYDWLIDEETPNYLMPFIRADIDQTLIFWGDREEVPAEQRAAIKACGCRYRGRGEWPFCLSFRRGYMPATPDEQELAELIPALQNFFMLCLAAGEKQDAFSIGDGEMLLRFYDEEQQLWLNVVAPRPVYERKLPRIRLMDEVLKARLKQTRREPIDLEMDFVYLGCPIREKGYARLINPLMLITANCDTGIIVGSELLRPDDDRVQAILQMLIPVMERRGRVRSIRTRNPYVAQALEDLCAGCGIRLEHECAQLEAIDEYLRDSKHWKPLA